MARETSTTDVAVRAVDRAGLEQLCRYLLWPAVAQERLRLTEEGRIVVGVQIEAVQMGVPPAPGDGPECVRVPAERRQLGPGPLLERHPPLH